MPEPLLQGSCVDAIADESVAARVPLDRLADRSATPGAQSISNFAEYFGPAVPACADVRLSIVGFTPPAVNYHGAGTGTYGGYSSFSHAAKAEGPLRG